MRNADAFSDQSNFETGKSWDDLLLDWFVKQSIPMAEKNLQLGNLKYHQFSTLFTTVDGRKCTSHGKSENRKIAAIKCVAEYVERMVMTKFFQGTGKLLPAVFHTSNGWAVHRSVEEAQCSAYRESVERHLLLKSFIKFGWSGFKLVEQITSPEVTLYFLTSRYTADQWVSGIVVAKSPLYTGVSLGYCAGNLVDIGETSFWESAIYEAIDKILVLDGKTLNTANNPESWLVEDVKFYLESPFDLEILTYGQSADYIRNTPPQPDIRHSFNLSETLDLEFPLYAAYISGGDLIPIFRKNRLDQESLSYLKDIFSKNNLQCEIPERQPVL